MTTPDSRYAFIAPTYKQAKNVAWDLLKYYSRPIPGITTNETELSVIYPNSSKIQLYGADNPDSLRGIGLWGVVFDEYSQQPSNIFSEIIRPALSDHEGYAVWIGTPQGKNEFYRLYLRSTADEDWYGALLRASESGILTESELEDAKKTMGWDEYQQEFECSFDASVKGAYYSEEIVKMRNEGRVKPVPHDSMLPVFTVWDLGNRDATGIGFYQKQGERIRMIDYYEAATQPLTHFINVLKSKPYIYARHFAPHDIEVHEWTSDRTRLEIARELGIQFDITPRMSVQDGINAARQVMNRMEIDSDNCNVFLDHLSQYTKIWDDKKGMFLDRPKHDFTSHAADVHRYMAINEGQFSNELNTEDFSLYATTFN